MTGDYSSPLFCYNHPNRETLLRCNRCERPICTECAVLTPTGYRCKECVRNQQKKFENVNLLDYPLAIIIAAVFSFIGSYIANLLGFFTLFIAPVIGVLIAETIRSVLRKRRSISLYRITTIAVIVGSLPLLGIKLINLLFIVGTGSLGGGLWGLIPILWQGLYTFLVSSTVYYRLSGIKIG